MASERTALYQFEETRGLSSRAAAARIGVGVSTVKRWRRKSR